MTRQTNARLAGFSFLFYIGVAFPNMVLSSQATAADSAVAAVVRAGIHAPQLRLSIALTLLSAMAALALAVALYGYTRHEDHELALLAMSFRVGEGVVGASSVVLTAALLWLAGAGTGAPPPGEGRDLHVLAAFLITSMKVSETVAATLFAAGSTIFTALLLRARTIPLPLAWLGVLASVLLLVVLPAQLAGWLGSPVTDLVWIPMLLFEVPVGAWLLYTGGRDPSPR